MRSFFIFNISVTIKIKTRLTYNSVAKKVVIEVTIIKKEKDIIIISEITIEMKIIIIIINLEKIVNVDKVSLESLDTIITIII